MVRSYYSVYDVVADEYGDLIYAKNDAVASRLYSNIIKSHSEINPDDLELYYIGDFDDSNGVFHGTLRKICIGDDTSDVDSLS